MNDLTTKMRFMNVFSVFCLILLFFCLIQDVSAFNLLTTKDSLKNRLVSTRDTKEQMQILVNLSIIYLPQKEDSAHFFAQKATNLFAKTQDYKLYATALNLLGQTHTRKGNMDSALAHYKQALNISQKRADKQLITTSLCNIGGIYKKQGRYNQALSVYFNALQNIDSLEQSQETAHIFQEIAALYSEQYNPAKALMYYEKALKINKNLHIRLAEAQNLSEMGCVYYDLHNSKMALKYHLDALAIFPNTNDNEGLAQCYACIAHSYFEATNYSLALDYAEKGVQTAEKTNSAAMKAHTRMRLAQVYSAIPQPEKALSLLNEAVKIAQDANEKKQESMIHLVFVEMYKKQKDFKNALAHQQKAEEIDEYLRKRNTEQELSDLHANQELETKQQLAEEKLKYFEENEENDLLFRRFVATVSFLSFILFCVLAVAFYQKNKSENKLAEKNREISEQAAKLDATVKERTYELEMAQANVLAIINNTTDSIWSIDTNLNMITLNKPLIDGFFGELALSIHAGVNIKDILPNEQYLFWKEKYERCLNGENYIFEFSFQKKTHECTYEVSLNPIRNENNEIVGASTFCREITSRKQAEWEKTSLIQTLTESNKDLEQFAYIVSHNLRAPVARMGGLMQIFNENDATDPINKFVFEQLAKGAKELDVITHDLNAIVGVRSHAQEERIRLSLSEIFGQVKKSLQHELDLVNAKVSFDFSQADELYAVKSYMYNIFQNLLANTIKYRQLERTLEVKVWTERKGTCVYLYFQDNGMGIDLEKNGKKVFGLYNRFHQHIKGKGIGLHIVKVQVEVMNCKIKVKSEVNKGTCFNICFPGDMVA